MNYTTIEQSKKLLGLGLYPKTSDCSWKHAPGYENYKGEITGFWDEPEWGQSGDSKDLPCWSLGALLELMPKIKEDEDDGGCYPTLCKGFDTDMWHCVYRSTLHITDWYEFSIDAAFEMVVWLLENGYIKTKKK